MRSSLVLLTALVLALTVGACGRQPATDVSPPAAAGAPSTLPDGMGSGADDGVFPRTIGHFAGTTTIETAPVRVVVLSTGQLDGLLSVGVVPVGTTTARGAALVPAYLTTAFPEQRSALAAMSTLGTRAEPDVEAVAATDPDLILTNSTVDAAVRAQLGSIAPVVVTEGTGVNWKQDLLLLADAVGKRQAAQAMLVSFRDDAAALGERVPGRTTVSLTSVAPDRVRVFGVGSFGGSILADTGLARPAGQAFDDTSVDISLETLDRAAGDWIFYGVQGRDSEITSSAVWTALPAVASGQAVAVDYDTWFLNAGPAAARSVLTDLQRALAP